MPRPRRNFQSHLLYHVVQRGNKGQWVFLDDEDFAFSLALLRKKAAQYGVKVHDYCLTHSQGHWLLQCRTRTGISCLMRDMQSQTSKHLNQKYSLRPWRLFMPLDADDRDGRRWWRKQAYPLKTGVNWTPRFFATELEVHYRESIVKYIKEGPIRAGLSTPDEVYRWSGSREAMKGAESLSLLLMDNGVQPGPAIVDHEAEVAARASLAPNLQLAFEVASHRRIVFAKVLARLRMEPGMKRTVQFETPLVAQIEIVRVGVALVPSLSMEFRNPAESPQLRFLKTSSHFRRRGIRFPSSGRRLGRFAPRATLLDVPRRGEGLRQTNRPCRMPFTVCRQRLRLPVGS